MTLSNEVECDEVYVIAGHKGHPEVVKNQGRQGGRRQLAGPCGRGTLEQVATHITPDGTLGTRVSRNGSVHTIAGGTPRGSNLFHSFNRFDVGTGDTARFSGPNTIANILSRVTGGHLSNIDGRIQSTIPDANFYLLNPSGVIFGPSASLDVSGSFHVSTADSLRLGTNGVFHANLGEENVLTMAPPAAFGFLTESPATIRIQASQLQVPAGETLSLVGGTIRIEGRRNSRDDSPNLGAPSGRVNLVSVGSPGEVIPNVPGEPPALNVETFERLGEVTISNGALIDASGDGGGTVLIRGGRLLVDGSCIFADTLEERSGAEIGIDIQVTEDIVLKNGSFITTDALRESIGDAGTVVVEARQVTVTADGSISSFTNGPGQGGSVTVRATETVAISAPESGLSSSTEGSGTGGDIIVEARTIQLREGASITAQSLGEGNAGDIRLTATDTLLLSENSAVTAEATQADGGNIEVAAQTTVRLRDSEITTSVRGGTETVGGNITIDTEFVILENSQISANASEGQGGRIQITADVVLTDLESLVSASSDLGIDGIVDIRAPVNNLTGNMAPLPQTFTQAQALLPQRCAERLQGQPVSTFVLAGRDSVPAQPGGVLPIPLVMQESKRAQTPMGQVMRKGIPAMHPGRLGLDAQGQPRVQGWPMHHIASLAWDAACGGWPGTLRFSDQGTR